MNQSWMVVQSFRIPWSDFSRTWFILNPESDETICMQRETTQVTHRLNQTPHKKPFEIFFRSSFKTSFCRLLTLSILATFELFHLANFFFFTFFTPLADLLDLGRSPLVWHFGAFTACGLAFFYLKWVRMLLWARALSIRVQRIAGGKKFILPTSPMWL